MLSGKYLPRGDRVAAGRVGLGEVEAGMPHTFPTKWISTDGRTRWMVFSGSGEYDSFNLVKVRLVLK